MKYCTRYRKDFRYFDTIDEIIIEYNNFDKEPVFNIINIIRKHNLNDSKQRVILRITKELKNKDYDNFFSIKDNYHNIAILLDNNFAVSAKKLKVMNIPYFSSTFVTNYSILSELIVKGVSEVYIVEDFAFDIKNIHKFCKEFGVKIRLFPNIAQSPIPKYLKEDNKNNIKNFFIRPEDTQYYEPYVDVLELFCDLDKQNVLYKIYSSNEWRGNLKDLISGLNIDINNTCITNLFGKQRTYCNKKCAKGECNLCPEILSLATILNESLINKEVYINE